MDDDVKKVKEALKNPDLDQEIRDSIRKEIHQAEALEKNIGSKSELFEKYVEISEF